VIRFAIVLLSLVGLPFCGLAQTVFTGSPDPFVPNASGLGQITLTWSAPSAAAVQIRIGSADGQLWAQSPNQGSATTGQWVSNGMQFFLQDVTHSVPGETLATFTATDLPPNLPNENLFIASANGQELIYSAPDATLLEVHVNSPNGPLLGRTTASSGAIPLVAPWVQNNQMFFLQDVSGGQPTDYHHTRAVAVVQFGSDPTGQIFFGATSDLLLDSANTGRAAAIVYWYAPSAQSIEIHKGSADGPLITQGGSAGSYVTDDWVQDGTTLYLQNASAGDSRSSANTLATAVLSLQQPVEHFAAPLNNTLNTAFALFDRQDARFLSNLPGSTPYYMSSPDGTKVLALESQRIDVIDPLTETITSSIPLGLSYAPQSGYPQAHVWFKGPQQQDWLFIGPYGASVAYYVIDPAQATVVSTLYPAASGPFLFNRTDGRIYFQGGSDGTSLLAINANLQIEMVGGNVSRSDGPMALLPIGASGSLLIEQIMNTAGLPYPSFSSTTLLYDIQSGNVTNITSGQDESANLLPSLDGKSVYTQGIYNEGGSNGFYPINFEIGGSIIKYVLTATSPFLQQAATLKLPFDDPWLATQDDRFLYVWGSASYTLPGGLPGPTPPILPTPSVVVKVNPNTLLVDPSPALPGGPDLYAVDGAPNVITGHYTLDLPACRKWYCDATPWPARP
jgi:hypothetical protein